MNPEAGDRWIDPTESIEEQTSNRENKTERGTASELDAAPGYANEETLRAEIACAINRCSAENHSNTPDFILATYLSNCLAAFDAATAAREKWYGYELSIGHCGPRADTGDSHTGGSELRQDDKKI